MEVVDEIEQADDRLGARRAAHPRAGQAFLVEDSPELCGDARFDAAMAGLVELLCDEAGLPWPDWTSAPERFCGRCPRSC